jgi:hypothetical protein
MANLTESNSCLAHEENGIACHTTQSQDENLSRWMEHLPNEKQLCPLNQLTMPGSHNSASFWFDTSMELAPDKPKIISGISDKVGFIDSTMKSFVNKWALTQSWNVTQQLCGGIRYFDLRVAYRKASDEFRFVHGLFGHTVDEILEEIKTFLTENPKEVVLLDFNHLYGMEIEEHVRLASLINQCFGSMLHSPRKDRSIASLQELWVAGEQVIVFYDNVPMIEMFPSFFPSVFINSQWLNTDENEKVIKQVSVQGLASKAPGQYHVTQAIATPQATTIFKNLRGSLKGSVTGKLNKDILSLLRSSLGDKTYSFNILLFDHVEFDDLISIIIGYNYIY